MPAETSATRDIIVIGASGGGLEALRVLVRGLEPDLPATIFIVMHVGTNSRLVEILNRDSSVPVTRAAQGKRFARGTIHVAVPGHHLLLRKDRILLRHGPRENLSRPAVDPLFRSAARPSFRTRQSAGPQHASERSAACRGRSSVQGRRHGPTARQTRPAAGRADARHPDRHPAGHRNRRTGACRDESRRRGGHPLARFTCPECHGALWEIEDGTMLRLRCHVGHAFAADMILDAQGEEIDRLLGPLLHSHQERAELARRMAEQERAAERHALASRLEARAKEDEGDVQIMKELMRDGQWDP